MMPVMMWSAKLYLGTLVARSSVIVRFVLTKLQQQRFFRQLTSTLRNALHARKNLQKTAMMKSGFDQIGNKQEGNVLQNLRRQ